MNDPQHTVSESADKPWRDAELVNWMYHEKEMSGPEIAEELGCSVRPIYDRIEDTRSISEANRIWTWRLPLNIRTDKDGYERFQTKVHGESMTFAHHRLIAVAEHGFDALDEKVVHHKNGVPWDNRPNNLELMDQSDHVREHFEEIPPHEKAAIWALGETEGHTAEEVSKIFNTTRSTVTSVWKRINDGQYDISGVDA